MDEGPSALLIAATVAVDIGLAVMVGCVASSLWLRKMRSVWADDFAQRSRSILIAATGFTMLALVVLLFVQTAAMADVPLRETGPQLGPVLGSTQVGHAWLMAALCLMTALIAACAGWRRSSLSSSVFVGVATLAFISCRAAASHAASHGPISIAVVIEAIHLLSISLWIGMVLVAAMALDTLAIGREATARADAAGWIRQLSATATVALAIIVLTGIFNAWRGLGDVSNLSSTGWGRTLVLKLALVSAAVLLGGLNRAVTLPSLLPALDREDVPYSEHLAEFVLVARIEAAVLVAALIVAAFLAASAPAVPG